MEEALIVHLLHFLISISDLDLHEKSDRILGVDANYFSVTDGSNIKVGSNVLTVGSKALTVDSNMILMATNASQKNWERT